MKNKKVCFKLKKNGESKITKVTHGSETLSLAGGCAEFQISDDESPVILIVHIKGLPNINWKVIGVIDGLSDVASGVIPSSGVANCQLYFFIN